MGLGWCRMVLHPSEMTQGERGRRNLALRGLLGGGTTHPSGGAHGDNRPRPGRSADRCHPAAGRGPGQVQALGPIRSRGMVEPLESLELVGRAPCEAAFQAAVARGLTRFVGRQQVGGPAAGIERAATVILAWASCSARRPGGPSVCRAVHRHCDVSIYGHDLLEAPGRGRPDPDGEAVMDCCCCDSTESI